MNKLDTKTHFIIDRTSLSFPASKSPRPTINTVKQNKSPDLVTNNQYQHVKQIHKNTNLATSLRQLFSAFSFAFGGQAR